MKNMERSEEKRRKLPPQETPPVPSVPNRAHTEMRGDSADILRQKAPCAPKNLEEEWAASRRDAASVGAVSGNFKPGESDGNFTPPK